MASHFKFTDTATFEENSVSFSAELAKLDAKAGPVLAAALTALADEKQDRPTLLNDLFIALSQQSVVERAYGASIPQAAEAAPHAAAIVRRWFLEGIEIEGFRGINNEGAPLALKFKSDCINSISAPNGVGKSSIYEALSFALRGNIPKLERLLHAERPQDYYLNLFHTGRIGTVKLTLRSENGGDAISIKITRTAAGVRTELLPVWLTPA